MNNFIIGCVWILWGQLLNINKNRFRINGNFSFRSGYSWEDLDITHIVNVTFYHTDIFNFQPIDYSKLPIVSCGINPQDCAENSTKGYILHNKYAVRVSRICLLSAASEPNISKILHVPTFDNMSNFKMIGKVIGISIPFCTVINVGQRNTRPKGG